jgi:hypothetical protein
MNFTAVVFRYKRTPARTSNCPMIDCRSLNGAPGRMTRKTRSKPGWIVSLRERNASLVILFSRFLLTAPPEPRVTTTAKRVVGLPLSLNRSFNPRDSTLRAAEKSPLMSLLLRSRSRLERLLLIGGRELDPALGAPALENEPATLGGHSGTKAEFPRPFCLTGLIRPFHLEIAPC